MVDVSNGSLTPAKMRLTQAFGILTYTKMRERAVMLRGNKFLALERSLG